MAEALVVADSARARPLVDGQDQTAIALADAPGRLNVLGSVLGLVGDRYQPQARDIAACE